jgi:NAD(P)-dependent dehydrogenase (short-subunit alcohol dehydrogenase family)
MKNQLVLITGASQGIGHSLAELYLQNGFQVIGTSRSGKIDISHPAFEAMALDLSQMQSIKDFEQEFSKKGIVIDLLINNAGIGPDLGYDFPEEYSFDKTFDVNVKGQVFFTEAMIKHLNKGAKLINVSSKMGSIEQCVGTDSVAYRMSKTALNMYTKILTNRYAGQFQIATLHPGWVRTNISGDNSKGRFSPEESANLIYQFVSSNFKTGIFWNVETGSSSLW